MLQLLWILQNNSPSRAQLHSPLAQPRRIPAQCLPSPVQFPVKFAHAHSNQTRNSSNIITIAKYYSYCNSCNSYKPGLKQNSNDVWRGEVNEGAKRVPTHVCQKSAAPWCCQGMFLVISKSWFKIIATNNKWVVVQLWWDHMLITHSLEPQPQAWATTSRLSHPQLEPTGNDHRHLLNRNLTTNSLEPQAGLHTYHQHHLSPNPNRFICPPIRMEFAYNQKLKSCSY